MDTYNSPHHFDPCNDKHVMDHIYMRYGYILHYRTSTDHLCRHLNIFIYHLYLVNNVISISYHLICIIKIIQLEYLQFCSSLASGQSSVPSQYALSAIQSPLAQVHSCLVHVRRPVVIFILS